MKPCHRVLSPLVAVAKEVDRKVKIEKMKKNPLFLLAEGAKNSEEKMTFE